MTALALVANHIWQSTLFALVAAAGTMAFRRHPAAVRHGLWLAASIKFLVPFAALVAFGGSLGLRAAATSPPARREFTIVIDHPDGALSPFDFMTPASSALNSSTILDAVVPIGVAIWMAGTLTTFGVWIVRWRRVSAVTRAAERIEDGRDLALLREIEKRAGRSRPIAFLASEASLEPGVFGILRPVLVWPRSIAAHLRDEQIATVLAHEVSHVRRRDNLAAAAHMIVEALFWFHPMVWWIGARLIDERERACDEEVLRSGSEPEVYAETIIEACRIYVESPLACIAGVTGSDLNRRVERIMTGGPSLALSSWRKAVLAACAVAAVGAPIALGAATPPRPRPDRRAADLFARRTVRVRLQTGTQDSSSLPRFEVASVKQNKSGGGPVRIETSPGGRFTAVNMTLKGLVQFAYRVQSFQVSGGPDWIESERFDIVAKGDEKDDGNAFSAEKGGQPSATQLMLRALLADRFKLVVRNEPREQQMYGLILARADGRLGSDLRRSATDCTGNPASNPQAVNKTASTAGDQVPCGIRLGLGTLVMGGASLSQLATTLSGLMDRSVVDRTGLEGAFDASLKWTPDQSTPGLALKSGFAPPGLVDPNGPSLFTAVQEQLGLKLDSGKGPVDTLIVDRAERPVEN
jgi:uncharacterized protein (TIGR03435 family)